jgi:hypothetical protein
VSTTVTNPRIRFVGLLIIIAGAFMVVAGGVTWFAVSSQLKAEHITVAAVTPANPGAFAGKPVTGPITAYAQAAAINHHSLDSAGGRTYAQLGDDAKALSSKLAADGLSKAEIAKNPDVLTLAATRNTSMTASFLRASLFTSIVSFGLAALVIGLGIVFALIGFALRLPSSPVTTPVPTKDPAAGDTKA